MWIDPELDIASMPADLSTINIISTHSPASHHVTGPFKIMFLRSSWSPKYRWEVHSSYDATDKQGMTTGGCGGSVTDKGWGWHCDFRKLPLKTGGDKLEFDMTNDLGHWIYWVVHYKWDETGKGTDGRMEIWMRRHNAASYTKLVDYTGYIGLMTNDACYLKMGISAISDQSSPYVFYFDNFKVGDENSNFAEVDPLQRKTEVLKLQMPAEFQLMNQ